MVELLLHSAAGASVADRIADPAVALHVPHLIDVEVAHVVRRLAARGELVPSEADEAIETARVELIAP